MRIDTYSYESFIFQREATERKWNVFALNDVALSGSRPICQLEIMPSKGKIDDEYDFGNVHKAYRITATDFPRVGELDQVVKGEDLKAYLESVYAARQGY